MNGRPSDAAQFADRGYPAGGDATPSPLGHIYRPDVDGLRAVAVLVVVLFHAGLSRASGGFVGVDVFFVISGFVIGKSLLSDLDKGRFSISAFYERRIRRIFPALFFTMALTWIAAFFILLPSYFVDFSKSLAASAGFVSNLYFWKSSGYFDTGAHLRPLLHTWSLSVEEQYYIFAPIAFFLIYRFMGRRWLWVLVPAALASLALSAYATGVAPTANFFLLPTRAWELLLGALLAVRPPPPLKQRWAMEGLAVMGLALIGWAVFAYTEATPFPGLAALPPCLGAALLIYAGTGRLTVVGRMLAVRPMVGIGLISYSLYLVHWPIISLMTFYNLRAPQAHDLAPILALSLALAYLSWRFVEKPFRNPKFNPGRPAILWGGAAFIALALAVGGLGVWAKGFPDRFPPDAALTAQRDPQGQWGEGTCFLDNNPDIARWNAEACTLTRSGQTKVMLWGDSYAAHYTPGIRANADQIPYTVIQYTAAGCPPVLSYVAYGRPKCALFNRNALAIIERENIETVVIAARWIDLQRRGLDELRSTIEALGRLGVKVHVIGQSPLFTTDVELIAANRRSAASDNWTVSFDDTLNQRLSAIAGPGFIDPIRAFCVADQCPFRQGDRLLFGDDGHYSLAGSARAVQSYFPLIERRLQPGSVN